MSAASTRIAPTTADSGTTIRASEVRSSRRTMCGDTSAMKPIGPAMAITGATSRTAPANSTALVRRTPTPSPSATSSPNFRMFNGRPARRNIPSRVTVQGATRRTSSHWTSERLPTKNR